MADGSTHPTEPVVKVVATVVSVTIGLTNDRQMTFQSGYEGDETDEAVNGRLDRMMRIADRLQARYKLKEVKEELVVREKALTNFEKDYARLEVEHETAQAERLVEIARLEDGYEAARKTAQAEMDADILTLQDLKKDAFNEGLEAYRKAGRMVTYVPAGKDKANIARVESAIQKAGDARDSALVGFEERYKAHVENLKAEHHKVQMDREQHLANLTDAMERHRLGVAEAKKDLAELTAVAEG